MQNAEYIITVITTPELPPPSLRGVIQSEPAMFPLIITALALTLALLLDTVWMTPNSYNLANQSVQDDKKKRRSILIPEHISTNPGVQCPETVKSLPVLRHRAAMGFAEY